MNIVADMKKRALAEFDRLVTDKERGIREKMTATGATAFEIDAYLEACPPSLAEQRATVGRIVTVGLMKVGLR